MIQVEYKLADPVQADLAEAYCFEHPETPWSLVAYPEGESILRGYFDSDESARQGCSALEESVPGLATPSLRAAADEDWKQAYRHHLQLRRFGRLVWVPVWEQNRFEPEPGDAIVYLDSGMAFGTGSHETTRLCARRLMAYARANEVQACSLIDAGCGSGLLALSAARLGFGRVHGFDIDPDAVRISEENAALNNLEETVGFATAEIDAGLPDLPVDVVVANIETPVLRDWVMELLGAVRPGGWLILSGVLAVDRLALEKHYMRAARLAWPEGAILEAEEEGEWCSITVMRER